LKPTPTVWTTPAAAVPVTATVLAPVGGARYVGGLTLGKKAELRTSVRLLIVVACASLGLTLAPGPVGAQTSPETFAFTGAAETFTVPADVCQVTVTALGAAGGGVTTIGPTTISAGGQGGSATATVPVTAGESLVVNVGGRGASKDFGDVSRSIGGAGGFNGGAKGGDGTGTGIGGGGGGGASDVRQGGGALANRVVVAGGAGGGGSALLNPNTDGGAGGGSVGADGSGPAVVLAGSGGTQSAGGAGGGTGTGGTAGAGGAGGDSTVTPTGVAGGGGGGGLFGGGGGSGHTSMTSINAGAGGGGSGFTPDGTGLAQGGRMGDGQVTITWTVGQGCPASPVTPPAATAGSVVAARPTFTG
jgi:hypothetical protein